MNVLFFLTPKSSVEFVYDDASLFNTILKMQERNYSAIPIISRSGGYVGTIQSGDILGYLKENCDLTMARAKEVPLKNVRRVRDNKAVNVNCQMESLVEKILVQNFVPVVDDSDNFIGIVTRGDVIKFMHRFYVDSSDIEEGVK